MAVSLNEKLQAYFDAGHRVSTGHGESPESRERRGQSLAIAQLKDAQTAADEALRSGNYKAYLASKASQNDSLIKYMVDMQKNASDNRSRIDAKRIERLTDIDKRLDAKLSTDVFKGLKNLQINNGLGDPGKTLKHPLMKEALVKELKSFGDDARGLNETRALLRVVGKQHNPPLSVEQVEEYLENREVPESWVNGRLARAKDAESRIHSDENQLRVQYAETLKDTRRGYAGGSWVRDNFGDAGDPAAAMMQNPQALQSAYEAEVPTGSRSKEFEIAERERQLGGTMSQTLRDIFEDEEFKSMASQLGLETSGEKNRFANAMIRGPKATERFINRYIGQAPGGRPGGAAARPGPGATPGAGYAEDLFQAGDEDQLARAKENEESTDLGGIMDVGRLGSGFHRLITEEFGGTANVPDEWLERMRMQLIEQRHIRQQEGGDAAEIERLSGMVGYIDDLTDHRKLGFSPKKSIEEKRKESPLEAPRGRERAEVLKALRANAPATSARAPEDIPMTREEYSKHQEELGISPDDAPPDVVEEAAAQMGDITVAPPPGAPLRSSPPRQEWTQNPKPSFRPVEDLMLEGEQSSAWGGLPEARSVGARTAADRFRALHAQKLLEQLRPIK